MNAYLVIIGISLGTAALIVILGAMFKFIGKWPWLSALFDKINLWSLTRKPKSRLYGVLIFSLAFLDVIFYSVFYHVLGLYKLACLFMIVGSILKFKGLFEIFLNTRSAKAQIKLTYVIMFGVWVIGSQLLYFTILLFQHIGSS